MGSTVKVMAAVVALLFLHYASPGRKPELQQPAEVSIVPAVRHQPRKG